jgi:hypothetical protein
LVRHAIEYLRHLLDVDRRTALGRERLEVDRPVRLSVPVTPVEYDALRFLSSLYPANPSEIMRASLLRALDPGTAAPGRHDDGLAMERTARVELGLDEGEAERLGELASEGGTTPEEMARWAMVDALGPLLDVHRPR